jgi:hypothetical protein
LTEHHRDAKPEEDSKKKAAHYCSRFCRRRSRVNVPNSPHSFNALDSFDLMS